jgi:hypothetical protein
MRLTRDAGLTSMSIARDAYRNVASDSSVERKVGAQQHTINTYAFPKKECMSNLVRALSRKGTCCCKYCLPLSPKPPLLRRRVPFSPPVFFDLPLCMRESVEMTLPSVRRLLLMFLASLSTSPLDPVCFNFSLPKMRTR